MRLLRHDVEDQWCGEDKHIEEGFACAGESRKVTVCGNCGLLFSPIVPQGATMTSLGTSSALTTDALPAADEDAIVQGLSEASGLQHVDAEAASSRPVDELPATASSEITVAPMAKEEVAPAPGRATSVLASTEVPEAEVAAGPNSLAQRFLLEHAADTWSADESSAAAVSAEVSLATDPERPAVSIDLSATTDVDLSALPGSKLHPATDSQATIETMKEDMAGGSSIAGQDPALSMYTALGSQPNNPEAADSSATNSLAQQFAKEREQLRTHASSDPTSVVEAANFTIVGGMSKVLSQNGAFDS